MNETHDPGTYDTYGVDFLNDRFSYAGPINAVEVKPMEIKIKYLNDEVPRLKKISQGDCIDLYAAEDIILRLNQMKPIHLGVAMQLPEGYEAHLYPRSSTFKKWGIIMANHTGIIDNSYCGDNDWWYFQAICLMTTGYAPDPLRPDVEKPATIIHKGDKIAQFRIFRKMPEVELVEVEALGNADRGGIGSTGAT